MTDPLPCICCGTQLESAIPGTPDHKVINQPYKGTVFTSTGQYGSTVWDELGSGRFLEITICDECLVAQQARVLRGTNTRRPETKYVPWDPEES
jgi:hypothetical protein